MKLQFKFSWIHLPNDLPNCFKGKVWCDDVCFFFYVPISDISAVTLVGKLSPKIESSARATPGKIARAGHIERWKRHVTAFWRTRNRAWINEEANRMYCREDREVSHRCVRFRVSEQTFALVVRSLGRQTRRSVPRHFLSEKTNVRHYFILFSSACKRKQKE